MESKHKKDFPGSSILTVTVKEGQMISVGGVVRVLYRADKKSGNQARITFIAPKEIEIKRENFKLGKRNEEN